MCGREDWGARAAALPWSRSAGRAFSPVLPAACPGWNPWLFSPALDGSATAVFSAHFDTHALAESSQLRHMHSPLSRPAKLADKETRGSGSGCGTYTAPACSCRKLTAPRSAQPSPRRAKLADPARTRHPHGLAGVVEVVQEHRDRHLEEEPAPRASALYTGALQWTTREESATKKQCREERSLKSALVLPPAQRSPYRSAEIDTRSKDPRPPPPCADAIGASLKSGAQASQTSFGDHTPRRKNSPPSGRPRSGQATPHITEAACGLPDEVPAQGRAPACATARSPASAPRRR